MFTRWTHEFAPWNRMFAPWMSEFILREPIYKKHSRLIVPHAYKKLFFTPQNISDRPAPSLRRKIWKHTRGTPSLYPETGNSSTETGCSRTETGCSRAEPTSSRRKCPSLFYENRFAKNTRASLFRTHIKTVFTLQIEKQVRHFWVHTLIKQVFP